jgi:hypothetical protein
MFSGLNLAFFSITRLRLEIEAANNHRAAEKVLRMREDSNFLLSTILWGNVGINVLLTLLSKSVMTGVLAFVFSTFVITLAGEIIPQAYFSRHALRMASLLSPVLKVYQIILYPVAKLSSKLLDIWLGEESIQYFKEHNLKQLIQRHVEDTHDIDYVEGIGAINFLTIDDIMTGQEGEPVEPDSIVSVPFVHGKPDFPTVERSIEDPFLQQIQSSKKKWVIITDKKNNPRLVMDADGFIRHALFDAQLPDPYAFSHFPIIVRNASIPLGEVVKKFKVEAQHENDDVIDRDIILIWDIRKRIITGSDILGRLLRGIVKTVDMN